MSWTLRFSYFVTWFMKVPTGRYFWPLFFKYMKKYVIVPLPLQPMVLKDATDIHFHSNTQIPVLQALISSSYDIYAKNGRKNSWIFWKCMKSIPKQRQLPQIDLFCFGGLIWHQYTPKPAANCMFMTPLHPNTYLYLLKTKVPTGRYFGTQLWARFSQILQ